MRKAVGHSKISKRAGNLAAGNGLVHMEFTKRIEKGGGKVREKKTQQGRK